MSLGHKILKSRDVPQPTQPVLRTAADYIKTVYCSFTAKRTQAEEWGWPQSCWQ